MLRKGLLEFNPELMGILYHIVKIFTYQLLEFVIMGDAVSDRFRMRFNASKQVAFISVLSRVHHLTSRRIRSYVFSVLST